MKIYYTTSKISKEDSSFYGIFAEDGGKFYFYNPLGKWEEVKNDSQIEYYKTCKKVDLEEYMSGQDQPQTLQIFQRTAPRKIKKETMEFIPNQEGIIEISQPKKDNSYVNSPEVVLCKLPDGTFFIYESRDKNFERIMGQKLGRIRILHPRYIEDGNYTLTDTNTKAVPKDIFEDEVVETLEEMINPANENC